MSILSGEDHTNFIWAGDQLAQEIRGGNLKTYIFEPESFKPLAVAQNDSIYHYHLDHLGTPKELTNEQGKIVWKARYKTYGSLALKEVDEFENNLRFQGQYYDLETGLHYNRHRYYDPSVGQFISQDPIGLLGGVNNYQYAPNPTGWVDPFGLSCKEIPENYNILTGEYKGVDINLFNSGEAIHHYAKNVINNGHSFRVGGHGSPNIIVDKDDVGISPKQMAEMIKAHPKFIEHQGQIKNIDLLSCNTGKGGGCYAQQLADEMGMPVKAPDQFLWYFPDGRLTAAGMTPDEKIDYAQMGKINIFNPR